MRLLERLFRRAGLPLSMTEGFHPKPRVSFPSALPLGVAGKEEVLEVELSAEMTPEELRETLDRHAPVGLKFGAIELLHEGAKKAALRRATFEIPVPAHRQAATQERVADLLSCESHHVDRGAGRTTVDLRRDLDDLRLEGGVLSMRLVFAREGTARPREVLEALALADLEQHGAHLSRTVVELTA